MRPHVACPCGSSVSQPCLAHTLLVCSAQVCAGRLATSVRQVTREQMEPGPTGSQTGAAGSY